MGRQLGFPGMPFVTLRHPVGGASPDVVRQKADAVVDDVISVLTTPAPRLEELFRGRGSR